MDAIFPGLSHAPNLHPIFVHFPVALLPVALGFWLVGLFPGREQAWRCGRALLYLATLGAALAVTTGYLAANGLGHDSPGHDLVHDHRNLMLVAAGLMAAASLLAYAWRRSESFAARAMQVGLLAFTVAVLVIGADRGGQMVFRYGIGTAGEQPPGSTDGHDHDHGAAPEQERHGHERGTPAMPEALSLAPGASVSASVPLDARESMSPLMITYRFGYRVPRRMPTALTTLTELGIRRLISGVTIHC